MLPSIIKSINNTVSRTTGLRPVDVNPNNSELVWRKVYAKQLHPTLTKKPKFTVGETVRISRAKKIFEKGYFPNFSDHIFKIYKVHAGNPNYYFLKDADGELIHGRFYEEELQSIREDEETSYRIEKILKKRKRFGSIEYLVKFIDYNTPSWIKESDIVN